MSWIFQGTTGSQWWQCRLVVDLVSQSIANNTSTLDFTFQVCRTNSENYGISDSDTTYSITTSDGGTGNLAFNCQIAAGTASAGNWKDIGSKFTKTFTHSADGSKSITCSASWVLSFASPKTASVGTNTVTLPTLATKPTSTTFTIAATTNGKMDANKVVQGEYKLTAQGVGATGDTNYTYQYAYSVNGGTWTYIGFSSSNSITHNTSSFKPGDVIEYKAMAGNSVGNSPWNDILNGVVVESRRIFATINKVPDAPANVWVENNNKYQISSIKVSWNPGVDPNGQNVTHELQYRTTGYDWAQAATGSMTTYTLDISTHPLGTAYDFRVRAIDSVGGYGAWKELLVAAYKSAPPKNTSISLNKTNIAEGSVIATASCTDTCYPTSLTYKIEYKIGAGSWINSANTSNAFAKDLTSSRGEIFTFRATASNLAGTANTSNEISIKSNSLPTVVSNVTPAEGPINKTIVFNWNASTDSDNQTISYEISFSKNNGAYSVIATVSTTSYSWTVPQLDADNTIYKFAFVTIDSLGGRSAQVIKTYTKSAAPTAPTNITPNISGTYSEDIVVNWTHADFKGLEGNYKVLVLLNDAIQKVIDINKAISTTTINIAELTQGASLKIGVQAVNQYSQSSATTYTTASMKINSAPTVPRIVYPLGGLSREFYGDNIRLYIYAGTDPDTPMYMHVSVNGEIFSSNALEHRQYFSATTVNSSQVILFKKKVTTPGVITLQAYASDGYLESPKAILTLNKKTIATTNIGDDITATMFKNIATAIGVNRVCYELSDTAYIGNVAVGDEITAAKVTLLNNALKEMHNKIDIAPTSNLIPYVDTIASKIFVNGDITAEIFNLIISNL